MSGASQCRQINSHHLSKIKSLDLADKGLTSLRADDLDGLSDLLILDLSGNNIVSLDEDVFEGLPILSTLDLSENSIVSLDEDVFDGLSKLKWLSLSDNAIVSLDEDVFDGLSNLDHLILRRNSIVSLDEDVFDGLSKLVWLNLSENEIVSLDEDIFDGLSNLEDLYLSENEIVSLDEDIFDGLSNLDSLDLSVNDIASLDEDIFDGLSNLDSLDLSVNDIASLDEDIFDGLSDLWSLHIYGNRLGDLPLSHFRGKGLSRLSFIRFGYRGDDTGRIATDDELKTYRAVLPRLVRLVMVTSEEYDHCSGTDPRLCVSFYDLKFSEENGAETVSVKFDFLAEGNLGNFEVRSYCRYGNFEDTYTEIIHSGRSGVSVDSPRCLYQKNGKLLKAIGVVLVINTRPLPIRPLRGEVLPYPTSEPETPTLRFLQMLLDNVLSITCYFVSDRWKGSVANSLTTSDFRGGLPYPDLVPSILFELEWDYDADTRYFSPIDVTVELTLPHWADVNANQHAYVDIADEIKLKYDIYIYNRDTMGSSDIVSKNISFRREDAATQNAHPANPTDYKGFYEAYELFAHDAGGTVPTPLDQQAFGARLRLDLPTPPPFVYVPEENLSKNAILAQRRSRNELSFAFVRDEEFTLINGGFCKYT